MSEGCCSQNGSSTVILYFETSTSTEINKIVMYSIRTRIDIRLVRLILCRWLLIV